VALLGIEAANNTDSVEGMPFGIEL